GSVAMRQGDNETANKVYEEGRSISLEIGDMALAAHMIARLGLIAYYQREFVVSRSFHEESLGLRREFGDPLLIAASLYQLGLTVQELGDCNAAKSLYSESLEIRSKLGDLAGIVNCLEAFADLASETAASGCSRRGPRLFGAAEALRESISYPIWPQEL